MFSLFRSCGTVPLVTMISIYVYYWSHLILSCSKYVILFQICLTPLSLFLFLTSYLSNFYFAFLLYRPEGYCRVYLSANIIASRVVPTILGMVQDQCLFYHLSRLPLLPLLPSLSCCFLYLRSISLRVSVFFLLCVSFWTLSLQLLLTVFYRLSHMTTVIMIRNVTWIYCLTFDILYLYDMIGLLDFISAFTELHFPPSFRSFHCIILFLSHIVY